MGFKLAMNALVVNLVVVGAVAGVQPSYNMVPAMYVFGDSTLDVGNNNYLNGSEVPRADKPFYGIDLPGSGKPTGRFSNGYNVADFVAKNLGFDKSPLAYLMLRARKQLVPSAIARGVSYASAGAGILDSTNAGNNIPLSQQVRHFESTKAEMVAKAGSGAVTHLLSESFFLLGAGSNDLFDFARAQTKQNRSATKAETEAFVASLVSNYSAAVAALHGLGARKFGIINMGPVGCVPRVRVLSPTGACAEGMNQLAAAFNTALKAHLEIRLAAKLPGLRYSLADSFGLTTSTDTASIGFASADSACCGGGRLGAEAPCTRNSTLCADRDRFVFWDPVHPSQRSAMISAHNFFNGQPKFTSPVTFKQLAQHT